MEKRTRVRKTARTHKVTASKLNEENNKLELKNLP